MGKLKTACILLFQPAATSAASSPAPPHPPAEAEAEAGHTFPISKIFTSGRPISGAFAAFSFKLVFKFSERLVRKKDLFEARGFYMANSPFAEREEAIISEKPPATRISRIRFSR